MLHKYTDHVVSPWPHPVRRQILPLQRLALNSVMSCNYSYQHQYYTYWHPYYSQKYMYYSPHYVYITNICISIKLTIFKIVKYSAQWMADVGNDIAFMWHAATTVLLGFKVASNSRRRVIRPRVHGSNALRSSALLFSSVQYDASTQILLR